MTAKPLPKGVFRAPYRDPKTGEQRHTETLYIRFCVHGVKHREAVGAMSPLEAERLRARRITELTEGRFVGPEAERVRVADLEDLVRNDYTARELPSVKYLTSVFRPLRAGFPGRCMGLTLAAITAYVTARKAAGASAGTVALELAFLHRGLSLAIKSKKLPAGAMPEFPKIQVDNARRVFADRADVEAIAAHMPEVMRPILVLAFVTGWRKAAILSRTRASVDLERGWLELERKASKNKRPYRVRLVVEVLDLLRSHIARNEEYERRTGRVVPWLFHIEGEPIKAHTLDKEFNVAKAVAGLRHLRFHDIRRGAIRLLRRARLTEHEIMEWVGLRTRAVFDRYDIIDEERLTEMSVRVQEYYEGETKKTPTVRPFGAFGP